MDNKEKNFISAIVYLHNDGKNTVPFFEGINKMLSSNFEKYELIAVNDACTDNSIKELKEWAKALNKPLTILNMSLYQKRENSMNAGLDISIGDYVMEFDSVLDEFDFGVAFTAYKKCLEGNDVVTVCPTKKYVTSSIFYFIFNSTSGSAYKLKTDIMRVVTRRGINRVHGMSEYLPYRKAAYAASGLKMVTIDYDRKIADKKMGRFNLAVDSLALYTTAGYRVSVGITISMLIISLAEIIYTIYIYCVGKPIEGWTTTMMVLSLGFFGLFVILTIILKYLSLILDMNFKKQKYLIEGIEKIQK